MDNRILIHAGIEHISGNAFESVPSADAIFMKVRNTVIRYSDRFYFYVNSLIIFTLDLSTLFTKFIMDL